MKKSQNGDTLGPVELNVRLEHSNQGDRCEQDDQGEVSIIIFGKSKSSGFQKYSTVGFFRHFVFVFVFVIVFVFVFAIVFLLVMSCPLITLIKCVKGHKSLGSLLEGAL